MSLPNIGGPIKSEEMILLKKQKYKIFASIGPISSVMQKLPVVLDKGPRPSSVLEDELTPFLKSQVTLVATATRIHDATTNHCKLSVAWNYRSTWIDKWSFWPLWCENCWLYQTYSDQIFAMNWLSASTRGHVPWSYSASQQSRSFIITMDNNQQTP